MAPPPPWLADCHARRLREWALGTSSHGGPSLAALALCGRVPSRLSGATRLPSRITSPPNGLTSNNKSKMASRPVASPFANHCTVTFHPLFASVRKQASRQSHLMASNRHRNPFHLLRYTLPPPASSQPRHGGEDGPSNQWQYNMDLIETEPRG